MANKLAWLVMLLLAVPVARGGTVLVIPINDEFLDDPVVRAYLADVLREAGSGRRATERGAFLLLDERGEYRCLLWPSSFTLRRESFTGPIPDNTVAIVHNHPEDSPFGSFQDQQQARRIGVPIFVLTRFNIYLVEPSEGKNVPVLRNRFWLKRDAAGPRCEQLPRARR